MAIAYVGRIENDRRSREKKWMKTIRIVCFTFFTVHYCLRRYFHYSRFLFWSVAFLSFPFFSLSLSHTFLHCLSSRLLETASACCFRFVCDFISAQDRSNFLFVYIFDLYLISDGKRWGLRALIEFGWEKNHTKLAEYVFFQQKKSGREWGFVFCLIFLFPITLLQNVCVCVRKHSSPSLMSNFLAEKKLNWIYCAWNTALESLVCQAKKSGMWESFFEIWTWGCDSFS